MNLHEKELQIALEMDNNLVVERNAKATIKIDSRVEKEITVKFLLKSEEDKILSEGEKEIQLKEGLNEVSFTMGFAPESRTFNISVIVDNSLELKHQIYRLSPFELSNLEKEINKFGKKIKETQERSKFQDFEVKLSKLKELIQEFDPKTSPIQIRNKIEELNKLLEKNKRE